MSQHKTEAERALEQVVARLKSAEPLEGLARFQLTASVEYALAEVRQIQELKRVRRVEVGRVVVVDGDGVPERSADPPDRSAL